jgi:nucleoside-diphosphate kinase
MGSTNPTEADENTIRKLYGTNIQCNAVHGSDSLENANIEIAFFFNNMEIIN